MVDYGEERLTSATVSAIEQEVGAETKAVARKARLEKQISKLTPPRKPSIFKRIAIGAYRTLTAPPRRLPASQERTIKRFGRMIYPVIPEGATVVRGQGKGVKPGGGRGRPRGSLKAEYKPYGGVFGYRKFIRAQKAARKYAAIAQRAQMYQQIQQQQQVPMPQQVPIPQEMAQYQQYPQEIPQIPAKKPIGTVFKSSGGSPYPPVNPAPLQGTATGEFYEDTDAFTGRRILRRRLPAEAWARGG